MSHDLRDLCIDTFERSMEKENYDCETEAAVLEATIMSDYRDITSYRITTRYSLELVITNCGSKQTDHAILSPSIAIKKSFACLGCF